MAEYIDRQAVLDAIWTVDPENDGSDGCAVVLQNQSFTSADIEALVSDIPAANVREDVHAEWLDTGDHTQVRYCSRCGVAFDLYAYCKADYNFCPSCGAKMVNRPITVEHEHGGKNGGHD